MGSEDTALRDGDMLRDELISNIGSLIAALVCAGGRVRISRRLVTTNVSAVQTSGGRRHMERISVGGTLWYGDLEGMACGFVDEPN